jgi:hypothetical protein
MSEFTRVGNYYDRVTAELAKSVLDVENIPSYIQADDMGGMRPYLLTGAGGVWLIVRAEDAGRASELLQGSPQKNSPETETPAA